MTIDECLGAAARRASRVLQRTNARQGMVVPNPLLETIETECAHFRRHLHSPGANTPEDNKCAREALEQIVLAALILYSTSPLNTELPVPPERYDA